MTAFILLPLAIWGAADVYLLYRWIRKSKGSVIASTVRWWDSK